MAAKNRRTGGKPRTEITHAHPIFDLTPDLTNSRLTDKRTPGHRVKAKRQDQSSGKRF